ncbi:MAG: hypothetical protein SGI74_00985 [Oligoflexia bacterium]|nr:hypothetical protein [Oligoflexia bacterium]
MKAIFCFMIFLSPKVGMAQISEKLLSPEVIFQTFIRTFSQYIQKVELQFPLLSINQDRSERSFGSKSHPVRIIFSQKITRVISENSIEEIITLSNNDKTEVITIQRNGSITGRSLEPTPNEDLLNFKFPNPTSAQEYILRFNNFPFSISFNNSTDNCRAEFKFGDSKINIIDYRDSHKVFRQYTAYYQGHGSSGKMDILAIRKHQDLWEVQYFAPLNRQNPKRVDPPRFFEFYQNWIQYSTVYFGPQLLMHLKARKGWPWTNN